jgi:cell wall-associated NlpC family hydrolase
MRSIYLLIFSSVFLVACHSSKTTSSSAPKAKEHEEKLSRKEREKKIDKAVAIAYKYKGTPYKSGGMDKKGIDCSGLINVSFKEADIALPRTTTELSKVGKTVSEKNIEKGDLLFFATKKKSKEITHVALVSKVTSENVVFIHASTKLGVTEDNLSSKYYKESFIKAIRPF